MNGRWPLLGDSRIKLISKGATMCDCVSYDNGLCSYYGVEVGALNYACDRGVSMAFKHRSIKWERKRIAILKRDEYLCQICKRFGKTTSASPVHHIYPVETHPQYAYDAWNLISLCNKHHGEMHDRTTNLITAKGLELQQRVSPPLNNA